MTQTEREYGCPDCHIPMLKSRGLGPEGFKVGLHCNRCDRDFHVGDDGLLYAGYKQVQP